MYKGTFPIMKSFSKWRTKYAVLKRSIVKNEASQLDLEVPNVSPAHNNIYLKNYVCS